MTDWVRDAYGLHLSTIEQVGHGSDVAARTWRGATADCDQYAVQVTGVGVPGGPEVLVQLSALGVRGAPAPVLSSEGRPWAERSESRLSVARWLSGSRAVEGGMTQGHWRAFGALLAEVHAVTPSAAVVAAAGVEDHDPER
ncbi:MAG: aminoglycoside phosphotransferase family protein, partial [Actinomycetota bacterium]|nr:aminoglycoside phosphotransferase family protein [Actinomycetota bacterium]